MQIFNNPSRKEQQHNYFIHKLKRELPLENWLNFVKNIDFLYPTNEWLRELFDLNLSQKGTLKG